MAPRKRKETPKIEVKEEEIDYKHVVPEAALGLIDSMEIQVQSRMGDLMAMRAALQQSIRETFQLQLIKLPKRVRDMPVKQFKEEFGGDITSVLLQDIETRLAASTAANLPATSLRTRAKGAASVMPTQRRAQTRGIGAETPAVGLSQGLPVGTVMRAPRGNEILYSRNGSPLGFLEQKAGQAPVLMTGVKAEPTALPIMPAAGNTVLQQAHPGGEQVLVDFDGGLDNVAEHQQAEVLAHLTALQKFATSVTGARRRR